MSISGQCCHKVHYAQNSIVRCYQLVLLTLANLARTTKMGRMGDGFVNQIMMKGKCMWKVLKREKVHVSDVTQEETLVAEVK